MKTFLRILVCLFVTQVAVAQKVTVENGVDDLGEGYNASYKVAIPHVSEKTLSKRWSSLLKDNDAKVKSSRNKITGHHTIIPSIGLDTMEVFSRIDGDDNHLVLNVSFQRKGGYISANSSENAKVNALLKDFALKLSREGIDEKVEEATDLLNGMLKEQSNLTSNSKRLTEENEKMRKEIEENEKKIAGNKSRLEELKGSITSQQSAVELTKALLKELE